MRPLRLRLRGITKFRGDLDLDLTDLPRGVIAVVGGNGAGKSTLLEALCPLPLYLALPSYPGRLGDSVSRGVRDAFVELEQEYLGHRWRHVIEVDPEARGGAGKTEAFLFRDGVPVAEHGRVGDYEAAVAATFPPSSVVFASAFSAQRQTGNFFELTKNERRDLFAELLGLAGLQAKAERAAAHRRRCEAALERLNAELAAVTPLADLADQLGVDLQAARDRFAVAEEEVARAELLEGEARRATTEASVALAEARSAAEEHRRERDRTHHAVLVGQADVADLEDRIKGLEGEQAELPPPLGDDIRAELDAAVVAAERAESEELQRGAAARAELDAAQAALVAARTQREVRVMTETSLARAQEAAREGELLAAGQRRARQQLAEVAGRARALGLAVDDSLSGHELHRAVDAVGAALEARRRTAERRDVAARKAELLGRVPCGGLQWELPGGDELDCSSCALLVDARAGAAERDQLEADLAGQDGLAMASRLADLRALLAEATALQGRAVPGSTLVEDGLAQRLAEVARLESAVSGLPPTPDLAPLELAVSAATEARNGASEPFRRAQQARAAAADRRARLVDADQSRAQRVAALEARVAQAHEALTEARNRRDGACEAFGAVSGRPDPAPRLTEATARQEEALAVERLATRRVLDARAAATAAAVAAGQSGQQHAQAVEAAARRDGLRARAEAWQQRVRGWTLLERALGRDGVQALEVDAAGPEVSAILNELLVEVFGSGRFQARLVTVQEAGRGRVQREVFDLEVLDGQGGTGEPRSADRFSAGERTLISEALKLAIAIYSARRAPGISTLYRDECDGPLEEGLAARYPAMLRRALELGGYERVLVISHRESVWAQADALIRVGGGSAVVEL